MILKLRNSNEPLAKLASDDNLCYINLSFKLGPKVLISFYNGDTLVTQDAHMNSNSSLNAENYEWKVQRGKPELLVISLPRNLLTYWCFCSAFFIKHIFSLQSQNSHVALV